MYTSDTNIRDGVRINGHVVIKGCPDGVNIHGKSYLKPKKKRLKNGNARIQLDLFFREDTRNLHRIRMFYMKRGFFHCVFLFLAVKKGQF